MNIHKYFVAILIYAFFTISISINAHEDDEILGYWLTSQSIVLIKNCEGNLCATIEHIFVEEGTDPKSILDSNNKDKALRERTIIGINLIQNFKYEKGSRSYKGGKIYLSLIHI